MEVTVVGAGLAGLTAALRLTQAGYRVHVFERYPRPGGLARVFRVGGEPLESFYHHLFTSDTAYVNLARELHLENRIEWLPSRMGIWTESRLWDFGTPASLLRFRPLSVLDKIRFAVSTLRLQFISRPEPFENVTAADWIRHHQGNRAWEKVWGPLFYQKFDSRAENVAMVWLWAKLRLRGRSRSRSGHGERLGYMRGSFACLVEALQEAVEREGGSVHLRDAVVRVERRENGFRTLTRNGRHDSDLVLLAVPIPDYLDVAGHLLPETESSKLARLEATAAICTVLEMSHSLTPYYWLNIADPDMPFGGLIEHTNYVPRERYGGTHVLYISNYVLNDHPLLSASKDELLERYLPALQRINPSFRRSWVIRSHNFRADCAQPIVTPGYRRLIPDFRTPVPGMYLTSMAQIYPEDRGQNYAIAYGERVARILIDEAPAG